VVFVELFKKENVFECMKKFFVLVIVSLISVLNGCSDNTCTSEKQTIEGLWKPEFLNEQGSAKAPNEKSAFGEVFIKFNSDGKINGMSGVNLFGGEYKVEGKNLILSNVFSTRRAGEFGEYEMKFLTALSKVNSYKIENTKLYLMGENKIQLILNHTP